MSDVDTMRKEWREQDRALIAAVDNLHDRTAAVIVTPGLPAPDRELAGIVRDLLRLIRDNVIGDDW